MKKIILILSFVLISSLTLFAQRKHRHHSPQRVNVEERMNRRAEAITNKMVELYGLSDKQKDQLLELNKSLYTKERGFNKDKISGNHKHYRHSKMNKECNKCNQKEGAKEVKSKDREQDSLSNPILNQQRRQRELNIRIEGYTSELKKIFSKKQYALYEKNVEDQLKNLD